MHVSVGLYLLWKNSGSCRSQRLKGTKSVLELFFLDTSSQRENTIKKSVTELGAINI